MAKKIVRLKREDREQQIIAGAITFFSEHGFAAPTRDLARELGITQPLLYRYFPSKQALIDRVYEELFLRRWNASWPRIIADRSLGLDERIRRFYLGFIQNIFSREWVRMFVHAGLENVDYNRRVLDNLESHILRPLCVELRVHLGYPDIDRSEVTPGELEYAWELHGIAFYYHIRKYVYGRRMHRTVEELVENMIVSFLAGAPAVIERATSPSAKEGSRPSQALPAA